MERKSLVQILSTHILLHANRTNLMDNIKHHQISPNFVLVLQSAAHSNS